MSRVHLQLRLQNLLSTPVNLLITSIFRSISAVPHRILFAQNLPESYNEQMLTTLFQPYPGFQEVRTVPGKKGIAFIEFQDQIQATIALQNLNGFQLTEFDTLHLTYGKQ